MRLGAGQRRSVDGDLTPRRRDAELRRSPPKPMLQGLIRAAVWPGSFSTARVIQPWPQLGSGRAATALAATAVGLRGETRWRARGSMVLGVDLKANGVMITCRANASRSEACAGLCCAAEISPRRTCYAGGGETPACGALAPRAFYGPRFLAQRTERIGGLLTEGLNCAGRPCRVVDDVDRRRRWSGARGGGRCSAAPGFWAARIDSGCSCGGLTGVRES